MADGQLSVVLRHVHKLMDAQGLEELTDGQLLERFISRHEEAAFAALVRRHGPMVLGVCRRVLHHWHAAEDAFQATFLVLFRKARSLDRRGSVANWLYTVAYHVALKARATAAHRRLRERQVVEMPQAESHPEEVWRDLQPVLDEELNSLPDKYRAPVLLCYVEGKTHAEAARLLGWPVGTVKGRLSRARELLRTRLSRRGITLSTGLLGVVLAEHAPAAVPGLLAESTIKTVALLAAGKATAGLAAAPAAALAEGVLKAMFATKLKIATALLLVVGVLGMGVGTVTHQALAQRQGETVGKAAPPPASVPKDGPDRPRLARAEKRVPATPPAQPEPDDKKMMTVTGRVLDTEGKPLPDAHVAVMGQAKAPLRRPQQVGPRPSNVLGQGKTDGEGRFRLTVRQTSKECFSAVFILARAAGHALGWQDVDADASQPKADVRLAQDQILRGRLVDLQGQPAAGVKVHVLKIMAHLPEQKYPSLLHFPQESLACLPEPATTDAQGRFSLRGLDPNWTVTIQHEDDRFARQEWEIKPPDKERRAEVTLALAPARVLEGTVTYADNGKPVPNARLVVQTQKDQYQLNPTHWAESRADGQGRFRVVPHAGNFFTVIAYPPAGEPYLLLSKELNWPKPDVIKQDLHLALPRGIVVRGTVTEAPSGKPVAGAAVEFEPYHDNNPFYRGDVIPLFREKFGQIGTSGPDGRFQLTVLPGPCHLLINGPSLDYLHVETTTKELYGAGIIPDYRNYPDALVTLDLKPDAGTHEVAVTLHRGVTLAGRVVGPDGKPVAQAQMVCRSYIPHGYILNPVYSKEVIDGRFELPGCDPEKTTEVFFLDAKNRLGTVVDLSGKQAGQPLTIQLRPCGSATARFVDKNGKPAANIEPHVEIVITPGIHFADYSFDSKGPMADTVQMSNLDPAGHLHRHGDAQGRVTFSSLIPGATYWIIQHHPFVNHQKEFKVEPGKTFDLGDITTKTRKEGAP